MSGRAGQSDATAMWVRGCHKESSTRFDPKLLVAELREAVGSAKE